MGNINNTRIGQSSVNFKGNDLGHTFGGVTFKKKDSYEPIKVDQYGDTPIDQALTGQEVSIVARLAEVTIQNWAVANPADNYGSGGAGSKLEFGGNAGKLLRSVSGLLRIHPTKNSAGDKAEDIVIYNAAVTEIGDVVYTFNSQRYLEVTFTALIDETKAEGDRLGHIGADSIS